MTPVKRLPATAGLGIIRVDTVRPPVGDATMRIAHVMPDAMAQELRRGARTSIRPPGLPSFADDDDAIGYESTELADWHASPSSMPPRPPPATPGSATYRHVLVAIVVFLATSALGTSLVYRFLAR